MIILFIILFAHNYNSEVLHIPFVETNNSKFKLTKFGDDSPLMFIVNSKRYGHTFYEGLGNNLITKVMYLGNELFRDTEERTSSFRRIVNVADVGKGTVISIYSVDETTELESIFYISKIIVYDLKECKRILNQRAEAYKSKTQKKSLRSVCYELFKTNSNNQENHKNSTSKVATGMNDREIESELDQIFRSIFIKNMARQYVELNKIVEQQQ